jgi:GTP-binding protein
MFYDRAKVHVQAGKGGDGSASLRREKFVPHGGPDGGDGGRGASVIVRADPDMQTLLDFQYRTHFHATNGGNGGHRQQHGKAGEDLIVRVPPGTEIHDAETGELLWDLVEVGQEYVAGRGGRGGLGNVHFATATHQTPRFAEKGEPGEARWIRLDLKIVAQVGIIGYPNVGKSTLLAAVSAAHPKIGDYPFTTLSPNLGVARVDDGSIVLADIPGLIEGAHKGVGLGHEFLRHVERTRILLHLLDGMSADPLADYAKVNEELRLYNAALAQRPQIVAVNKMDVPDAEAGWQAVHKGLKGVPRFAISAVSGQGMQELLRALVKELKELPEPEVVPNAEPKPMPNSSIFTVTKEAGVYVVRGERVERLASRTDSSNWEGIRRFEMLIRKMGVLEAVEKAGVQTGDTVRIGAVELNWGIREEERKQRSGAKQA